MESQENVGCPSCSRGNGLARAVAVGAGLRTMTYQCADCGHTWTETDVAPDDQIRDLIAPGSVESDNLLN